MDDAGSERSSLCDVQFKYDPSGVQVDEDASDMDKRGYARWNDFAQHGTAYAMMQGTTPHVSRSGSVVV